MYAVISQGGKQYRVSPGMKLKLEKLSLEPGSDVVFDRVLLYSPDDGKVVAEPEKLAGVKVHARVLSEGKNRKILVFKKKPKNDYKKAYGHRQPFSLVEVDRITEGKA